MKKIFTSALTLTLIAAVADAKSSRSRRGSSHHRDDKHVKKDDHHHKERKSHGHGRSGSRSRRSRSHHKDDHKKEVHHEDHHDSHEHKEKKHHSSRSHSKKHDSHHEKKPQKTMQEVAEEAEKKHKEKQAAAKQFEENLSKASSKDAHHTKYHGKGDKKHRRHADKKSVQKAKEDIEKGDHGRSGSEHSEHHSGSDKDHEKEPSHHSGSDKDHHHDDKHNDHSDKDHHHDKHNDHSDKDHHHDDKHNDHSDKDHHLDDKHAHSGSDAHKVGEKDLEAWDKAGDGGAEHIGDDDHHEEGGLENNEHDHVQELTAGFLDDIHSAVKKMKDPKQNVHDDKHVLHEHILVVFTEDGYQGQMHQMQNIARIMSNRHYTTNFDIGKLDVSNKKTAAKFNINNHNKDNHLNPFPTLKYYDKGIEVAYDGGTKENEILEWAIKRTNNQYRHEDCEKLAKTIAAGDKNHADNKKAHEEDKEEYHPHNDEYNVLVHFGADFDSPMFKAFAQTPWVNHDAFEHVYTGNECAHTYGAQPGGLSILKNHGAKQEHWTKEADAHKISKWMAYHSVPHFSIMNEDLSHSLFDETRGRHAMFLITEDAKQDDHVRSVFREGAENFNTGDLVFVQTGISNKHDHIGHLLGLTKKADLPQLWIVTPTSYGAIKYPYSGDAKQLSVSEVHHFANQFQGGFIQPRYLSEPESEIKPNKEGIIQLVRDTFDKVVSDPHKDVFVHFYDGEHEEEHVKIMKELADYIKVFKGEGGHQKAVPEIVFAMMDVGKNEIENLHFKHTPAGRLFSQTNKKGIEYVSPSFDGLEKKLKDLQSKDKKKAEKEQHKGLIEFEHNQHKFLLNWLYSHSQGYKHAFPNGVPKEHEDHFSGKVYDDEDHTTEDHSFKMEHNVDEKEVSGEDKHHGKSGEEMDTHLKDTSEGEHKSGEDKDHLDHHMPKGSEKDHEDPTNQDDPFKEEEMPGEDHKGDHHDPTADGVEHNDKHHGDKSNTDQEHDKDKHDKSHSESIKDEL